MHLIIVYVKYLQSVFEWQKEWTEKKRTKPKQQQQNKKIKINVWILWTMAQNSIIYYTLCNTQSKWKPIYKHNCDEGGGGVIEEKKLQNISRG